MFSIFSNSMPRSSSNESQVNDSAGPLNKQTFKGINASQESHYHGRRRQEHNSCHICPPERRLRQRKCPHQQKSIYTRQGRNNYILCPTSTWSQNATPKPSKAVLAGVQSTSQDRKPLDANRQFIRTSWGSTKKYVATIGIDRLHCQTIDLELAAT